MSARAQSVTIASAPGARQAPLLHPSAMAIPRSLLDKVWDAHTVRELPSGQTQLFIGLHLMAIPGCELRSIEPSSS